MQQYLGVSPQLTQDPRKYAALARALQQSYNETKMRSQNIIASISNLFQLKKEEQNQENDLLEGESEFYCECLLCAQNFIFEELMTLGQCDHRFCKNCCVQHAKQQIKSFQSISCPSGCGTGVSLQDKIFSFLPEEQVKTYKKAQFVRYTDREGLTRCPNSSCDFGVLFSSDHEQNVMECHLCSNKYCKKCWWPYHRGDCNGAADSFIQNKLLFAVCPGCSKKIQRNQGCFHMTCVCRYQFCYLCLGIWSDDHICPTNNSRIKKINQIQNIGDRPNANEPRFAPRHPPRQLPLIRMQQEAREMRQIQERQEAFERVQIQELYQLAIFRQRQMQRKRELQLQREVQLRRQLERKRRRHAQEAELRVGIFPGQGQNQPKRPQRDASSLQGSNNRQIQNSPNRTNSLKAVQENRPLVAQLNLQTNKNFTMQYPSIMEERASNNTRSPQRQTASLKKPNNNQMMAGGIEDKIMFLKHLQIVKPQIFTIKHALEEKERKAQVRLEKMRERARMEKIKQLEQEKEEELRRIRKNSRVAKCNGLILGTNFTL